MTTLPPPKGLDRFKTELHDALVETLKQQPTARRTARRRGRRLAGLAIAAVLTIGGTVAAAEILIEPEQLAATEIDCLYDPVKGGGVGIHPGEQDPVAACKAFLAGPGKSLVADGSLPSGPGSLVACVRPEVAKVVVIAGRPGDCERHGLDPLPGAYDPARDKVAKLQGELEAIEGSARCIPPEQLARRVQALLERSGWAGWRASLRPDLSDGPCGHVLAVSEAGKRTLSLDPERRRLMVWGESPQTTVDLLSELSPALAEESVARCFTLDQLKVHVRQRVAPTGRPVTFKVFGNLLAGNQLQGTAGARYAAGCAILEKVGPAPNGHGLVALINKKA
jgi:hypothetical protein